MASGSCSGAAAAEVDATSSAARMERRRMMWAIARMSVPGKPPAAGNVPELAAHDAPGLDPQLMGAEILAPLHLEDPVDRLHRTHHAVQVIEVLHLDHECPFD